MTEQAWYRHSSGVLIPRGTLITTQLDAGSLDVENRRLDVASERRGVRGWDVPGRRVKRSQHDAAVLDALTCWLKAEGLDHFGMVSFSDEYAERRYLYSLNRALDDVWSGLMEVPLNRGTIKGYRGKFVLCGEWHPSGRSVPHVHLAFESGKANPQLLRHELWHYFFRTRGRCDFQQMRDVSDATLYALKDVVKSTARDSEAVRFRLRRPCRIPKGRPAAS